MNWKKIVLFILFLVIGTFVFGVITVVSNYISLFLPLFFIAYVIFLVLILKEYSNKKIIIILLIFIIYFLIMTLKFPECSSWGYFGSKTKDCTCIGIEKRSWMIMDASWSQCVGIPFNYVCNRWDVKTGVKEKIPCD
ncbi:hypothetical protein HY636_05015 [Candidatus Woesearchaeota archaeon]|nr:hypothetical protein [Candidatus Woesearchaeota archaeon]